MIKRKYWKWRGLPGHFCEANECAFRLCTDIGKYRISTVGAMYKNGLLQEIGLNNHYETMVFKLKNGDVENYIEIDREIIFCGEVKSSSSHFDKMAEQMHLRMCIKYAGLQEYEND